MSTTDSQTHHGAETLRERFSAYLETATGPSDVALLLHSFELSLRATDELPKRIKSYSTPSLGKVSSSFQMQAEVHQYALSGSLATKLHVSP